MKKDLTCIGLTCGGKIRMNDTNNEKDRCTQNIVPQALPQILSDIGHVYLQLTHTNYLGRLFPTYDLDPEPLSTVK